MIVHFLSTFSHQNITHMALFYYEDTKNPMFPSYQSTRSSIFYPLSKVSNTMGKQWEITDTAGDDTDDFGVNDKYNFIVLYNNTIILGYGEELSPISLHNIKRLVVHVEIEIIGDVNKLNLTVNLDSVKDVEHRGLDDYSNVKAHGNLTNKGLIGYPAESVKIRYNEKHGATPNANKGFYNVDLVEVPKTPNTFSSSNLSDNKIHLNITGNVTVGRDKYTQFDNSFYMWMYYEYFLDEYYMGHRGINEISVNDIEVSYDFFYGMFFYTFQKVTRNSVDYNLLLIFGTGSNLEIRGYLIPDNTHNNTIISSLRTTPFTTPIFMYWEHVMIPYNNGSNYNRRIYAIKRTGYAPEYDSNPTNKHIIYERIFSLFMSGDIENVYQYGDNESEVPFIVPNYLDLCGLVLTTTGTNDTIEVKDLFKHNIDPFHYDGGIASVDNVLFNHPNNFPRNNEFFDYINDVPVRNVYSFVRASTLAYKYYYNHFDPSDRDNPNTRIYFLDTCFAVVVNKIVDEDNRKFVKLYPYNLVRGNKITLELESNERVYESNGKILTVRLENGSNNAYIQDFFGEEKKINTVNITDSERYILSRGVIYKIRDLGGIFEIERKGIPE